MEQFVHQFEIDVLVAENALSLPMNIPLGLALTELIAERDLTAIAHHHDFAWERQRYALHHADDYLAAAFPPPMEKIHHVTINSYAARQLARRTGMRSTVVPNVMDFENPPSPSDEYAADLRSTFEIPDHEQKNAGHAPAGDRRKKKEKTCDVKAFVHKFEYVVLSGNSLYFS